MQTSAKPLRCLRSTFSDGKMFHDLVWLQKKELLLVIAFPSSISLLQWFR